jgi:hypothetical protein
MAKKAEHWDDNWRMSESCSNFTKDDMNEFGYWVEGIISTRYGYVTTYSQEDHTDIRFIWDGRMYSRGWQREYSQQFIVTLAKRFVREITGHEQVG